MAAIITPDRGELGRVNGQVEGKDETIPAFLITLSKFREY